MAIQVVVEGGAVEQRRVGIISEMLPGCRLGSVCALAQLFSFLGSTQRGECERRPEGGVGHCGRSKVADASPPDKRLEACDTGSRAQGPAKRKLGEQKRRARAVSTQRT